MLFLNGSLLGLPRFATIVPGGDVTSLENRRQTQAKHTRARSLLIARASYGRS